MSQMTPSQARVIDPILTAVARGYESQNARVADALFPSVPVDQRAAQIISFGKESFQITDTKRAPGAATKRIQLAYSSNTYALVDNRLEAMVPVELEEEAATISIDMSAKSLRVVQDMMALERENDAAILARNADNYPAGNKATLAAATQWSHADSNPFNAIEAAKNAIRAKAGKRPNVMVVGPAVLSALRNHAMVLNKLSTSTDRTPPTIAQLQALFEIESIIEGEAIAANDAGDFYDVWGKDAILAYVSPKSLADAGSQSFGYTYQLRSRPVAEMAYADRNRAAMVIPYADARKAILVGNTSGYIFKAAAA